LNLYLDFPVFSHTPKQILPSCGGRPEIMISVQSLCHWVKPISSGTPSGGRARARITLGSERKFPHSDNRVVGILGSEQERAGTELCPIPRLRRDNGAALVARRIVSALGVRFCGKDRSNQDHAQSCYELLECCFHPISFKASMFQI